MKSMVLVLVDLEHTIELVGVFPQTHAAMEYIWGAQIGKRFTAAPVGDKTGQNYVELPFLENMAEVSLRDAPAPNLKGLGPLHYRAVWIRQQNMEGALSWYVATFSAADQERTHGPGDLRWAMVEGILTFASITSALGQTIEETHNTMLARDIQKAMLAPSARYIDPETPPPYSLAHAITTQSTHDVIGSALGPPNPEPEVDNFVCEGCAVAVVPGAIFPIASNEMTDHAYVEVCDVCRLFPDDVQAARVVSIVLDLPVKLSEEGRPYLEGPTFEEAEALAKSKQRPMPSWMKALS